MGKIEKVVERIGEKSRALGAALGGIRKQFGEGSIMMLGERQIEEVEVIPTGSLGLDLALGCGGLPRPRRSRFSASRSFSGSYSFAPARFITSTASSARASSGSGGTGCSRWAASVSSLPAAGAATRGSLAA